MDAQELRNLQEAYLEVVMNELDEGYKELPVDKMVAKSKSLSRMPREPGAPRWDRNAQRASDIRKTAGTHSRAKVKKVEKANRERGTQREEYDLYDIILSHLLDEGYAETIESAEAIMVNMSEDWRDSIVEDVLDEAAVDWEMSSSEMEKARNERKFGKQSFNQAGQTKLRRELHKSQRGMKKKDVRRWEGKK